MQATYRQAFLSFIDNAISVIQQDTDAIGLAAGGSWASHQIDAYSDLDLVLVTNRAIAPDLSRMRAYADKLGPVLASFRGDHVGEPRLLIVLYDDPLLHVDIKFLALDEYHQRVEDPVILWERSNELTAIMRQSTANYPPVDFQGTEDRFWIWVHYAALKIGRGEYFEAIDFLGFMRNTVLGPLLHLNHGGLPRGVRRAETTFNPNELDRLRQTVATPDRTALVKSVLAVITLYESLRDRLDPVTLHKNKAAQSAVTAYLATINRQVPSGQNQ